MPTIIRTFDTPAAEARYLAHKAERHAETLAAHASACRQGSMLIDLRHAVEAYTAAAVSMRTASAHRLQAFLLEGLYIDECVAGWLANDATRFDAAAADVREEWARRQVEVAATIPAFLAGQGATSTPTI